NGRLEVINLIATALGAPITAILDRPLCAPAPPVAGTRYSIHITVSGTTQTAEQSLALLSAAPSAANHIEKSGATVSSYESTIASTPDGNVKHRALVCVWAQMADSRPAWAIIAVRLDAVGPFMLAEAEGHLDLYNLAPFGEVVVSDYGLVPPDEIIAKVAVMFRVDGWQLRRRTMVRSDIHRSEEHTS